MLARLRHRFARRGSATVEFAVVAPLLMAIVAGIIEVGRLVMISQLAVNGSREAARYAVQATATTTAVTTYAKDYMASANIPNAAINSVTIEQKSGSQWATVTDLAKVAAGTPVRVTLSVNFDKVTWLPTRFFVAKDTAVKGVTVMRKE